MPVVDWQSNRIDLSHQDGAVDASVLEQLRHALHLNKFFLHLDLSYNTLDDECASMLCTIIKDKNALKTFSFVSCGITDKIFTYQLVPALCARGVQIAQLDLSKNDGVTDKSIDAICQLLRDANVLDLRLSKIQINAKSSKKLLKALEWNTTLEHFDLPFTVGFEVLNRTKLLLRRNLHRRKETSFPKISDNTKVLVLSEDTPYNTASLENSEPSKFMELKIPPAPPISSLMRSMLTPNRQHKFPYLVSNPEAKHVGDNGKAARSRFAFADFSRGSSARETTDASFPDSSSAVPANSESARRGQYWRQRLQDVHDTLNLSDPDSLSLSHWADPSISRSLKYLCILNGTL